MLPIEGVLTPAAGPSDALADVMPGDVARTPARPAETVGFDALFAALLGGTPVAPDATADAASSQAPLADGFFAGAEHTDALTTSMRLATESAAYAARTAVVPPEVAAMTAPTSRAVSSDAAPSEASASDDTGTLSASMAATDPAVIPQDVGALPAEMMPAVVPAVAATPTSSVARTGDTTLDTVEPELRARVSRVVERMRHEFGHDVRIVEGVRSQERQDALYAQGRTAPGPVVTWTRDSAHLDGHAVDVMIDGGYDNPEAFRRLSRIAREEGLRSLGPRDPGHLELPTVVARDTGATPSAGTTASPATTGSAVPARTAPVAAVADVANVASVAQVARTAAVARVASPAAVRTGAAKAVPASDNASSTDASRRAEDTTAARANVPSATTRVEDAIARLTPSLAGTRDDAAPVAAPSALSGVDMAARLEAVARVRDAQASQPLSRLVMDVPDAAGGVDRIAVQMRGGRVDASLNIADPMAASRLASRSEILAQALESRGYEAGSLQVSASRLLAPESLDLTRMAGLALEREGARGVASFLQDVSGGGLRDRQGSPSRHPDSSHTPRDGSPREDNPRRQPKRDDPGAR